MSSPTDTYKLLGAFVDELTRCGMRHACTSPGSRSTPLVLNFARESRLRCYSHVDERCSGFFAVGLAKACGRPVAVTCTSGTAVAELMPAVVEAHEARVPLIVCSADRPPELREIGAGQTIDQLKIFGGFAKWFFEVGTHDASPERIRWMRTLACRAYWTALEGRPGVVHLNFPLREPLVSEQWPAADEGARAGGHPFVRRPAHTADANATQTLHELIGSARLGVLVAGRHERDTPLAEAAVAFCTSAGWPLVADPMSGARRGETAIAHYDALLRVPEFVAEHTPEVVVRVGDLPVSKPLRNWLHGLTDTVQLTLDPEGAWQDPAGVLSHSLAVEPAQTLRELATLLHGDPDGDWLASWRSADERAALAIFGALATDGLSEPTVAAELGVLLPERATLFVASSMPVRDIETFWPARTDPPRVLCNRGANGIDGTVSSAFGAAAGAADPVVLLIGDVALAYDIGGLLAARRLNLKLTIVLLNNDGGGIFDFLPVAQSATAHTPLPEAYGISGEHQTQLSTGGDTERQDIYTRHIATPTGLDFAHAADLYGLDHRHVSDIGDFRSALEQALEAPRSTIVEVRSERGANVELHRRVWEAVAGAVAGPG
jgi:2-succinyl-5-enolpyruvyl-6-hydroxy-3-cyclohexene-1-carboxylate synthase